MSQEIQWLKIWEKFQIQDALDNVERLDALKKSNKNIVDWLKNRAENELKLYTKWILEQKIAYSSDNYFPELKWKQINDELINQEVNNVKERVKNSWSANLDDMWYLLVTFLEKIWQVETKKEEAQTAIVKDTKEKLNEQQNSDKLDEKEIEAISKANTSIKDEQKPAPTEERTPTEIKTKVEEKVSTLDKNLALQINSEVNWLIEKWEIWKINSLKNMPWVSFIKFDNQETMNKSWWKITAFTENNTKDFSNPKSWNYAWWHDLSSKSIAEYFNNFKDITPEEKTLLNNLKSEWIIKEDSWKIIPVENKAILVMFYPEWEKVKLNWKEMNWNNIREQIKWWLNHELAHWLYFTNPEFKKITDDVWAGLDPKIKKEVSTALSKNYKNTEFHATEFLSYVMFTWDKKDIISNIVPQNVNNKEDYIGMLREVAIWIINTTKEPSEWVKTFFRNNQEIEK